MFTELHAEPTFTLRVEASTKDLLKQYGSAKPPSGATKTDRCANALLTVRGPYLAVAGRYNSKAGTPLQDVERKVLA